MSDSNEQKAVYGVAGLGAANWGLTEAVNLNLVTELLGSGSGVVGVVYLVIGLAGLLSLAELAGVVELDELLG